MATMAERHRREGEVVPASKATRRREIHRRQEAQHGLSRDEIKALQEVAEEAEAADVAGERERGRQRERARARRGRRARKRAKRVAREARSGSFGQVIMLSLGLVVLYVALNNAQWFARALDAASTALAWLSDPGRAIPYATQEG